MTLHALQDVGDAVDVTREFLFPFELRRWLKLAVVAFFVGGATSFPSVSTDVGSGPDQVPGPVPDLGTMPTLTGDVVLILAAVVTVVVLLGVMFALVGAIMEFVFIESLRTGDVTIRRYWRRRWRQGLRLFGFRVAIGLPMLALVVGWLAILVVPLLTGGDPVVPVALFVLALPVVVVAGVGYWLVSWFTTVFVVPIMIHEEAGVLAGWRRLWPSIRTEWRQYLAYVLVGIGLMIATGLVASLALGIGAIVVLLPLAVLAAITYFTVSFSTTLGLAILAGIALLFVAVALVLAALVQVPILAFLRYYALLVLGDVEPALDLVADRRPMDGEDEG